MSANILLVDDEIPIVRALQRYLQDESDYTIFTAESGERALQILAHNNIDIVITDMRMPQMDGVELLRKVKQLYPGVARIILSGYADEKAILRAMLSGIAKMYLFKPWDNKLLLNILQQTLAIRQLLTNNDMLNVINKLEGINTLAVIYNKLLEMIDQEADLKEIAGLIEHDPGIAAKVLRIANSSFYEAKTGSVRQAISFLGLNTIKNIVLATGIFDTVNGDVFINKQIELIWKQASVANRLTIGIYEWAYNRRISDLASSAGLLHDIGKAVLLKQFPLQFAEIVTAMQEGRETVSAVLEQQLMGMTHQEMGAHLLAWWNMPQSMVEVALFHHDPLAEQVIDGQLLAVVHLADYYAWPIIGRQSLCMLDERVFQIIGKSKEDTERFIYGMMVRQC